MSYLLFGFGQVHLVVERAAGEAQDLGQLDLGHLGRSLGGVVDQDFLEGVDGLLERDTLSADERHEIVGNVRRDQLTLGLGVFAFEQVPGKIGQLDAIALGFEDERLANDVFEFADVAVAELAAEQFKHARIDVADGGAAVVLVLLDEVLDENRDVFHALTKGRNSEVDDVETLIEVKTELTAGDLFLERDVGGGNDADVDRFFAVGTDGEDTTLLQNTEQLGLKVCGEFGDFVEEDGAAIGGTEVAEAIFGGAGEGTLNVAEEFGLGQCASNGGAVHGDEIELRTLGIEAVNGFGEELFTGTRLTMDEDGGVADLSAAVDLGHELLHGRRDGHDADGFEHGLGALHDAGLGAGGGLAEKFLDAADPVGLFDINEVLNALTDGGDADIEGGAGGGQEDNLRFGGEGGDAGQEVEGLGGGFAKIGRILMAHNAGLFAVETNNESGDAVERLTGKSSQRGEVDMVDVARELRVVELAEQLGRSDKYSGSATHMVDSSGQDSVPPTTRSPAGVTSSTRYSPLCAPVSALSVAP